MTPTEQDKELDEIVDKYIYDIAVLRPYTRVTKEAKRRLVQLITADRKRVALEARIHEIGLMQHQARVNLKTSNAVADWGDIRIAELKAQQEKV